MFLFPPVLVTLLIGQTSFLIAFLFFLSWILIKKNKQFSGGLVLSLALIKPQFLLLPIFLFLMQRRYVVAGGILLGVAILSCISVATVGWHGFMSYLSFLNSLSVGKLSGAYQPDLQSQYTLQTSLMILFRAQTPSVIRTAWIIVDSVIVFLTCAVWVFKRPFQSIQFDLQWILLILATLLTSPHAHYYDLSLLIIPFIVIVDIVQSSPVNFKKLAYFLLPAGYILVCADARITLNQSEQFRSLLILVNVGFLLFVFFLIFLYLFRYRLFRSTAQSRKTSVK